MDNLIGADAQQEVQYCPNCNEPKHVRIDINAWHDMLLDLTEPIANYESQGTKKMQKPDWWEDKDPEWRVFPIKCLCERLKKRDEYRKQKQKEDAMKARELMQRGVKDQKYHDFTFAADDKRNPEMSALFYQYVEQFETMKQEQRGLIIYGPVGTGKTFYACAIANEIMKYGYSALITNLPMLIMQLLGKPAEQSLVLDTLDKVDLLVIDDFGIENETAFSFEKIFQILDARSRSKKPMIMTTNMSPEQFAQISVMGQQRINERIKDSAQALIEVSGNSRRDEIAGRKMRETMNMLVEKSIQQSFVKREGDSK